MPLSHQSKAYFLSVLPASITGFTDVPPLLREAGELRWNGTIASRLEERLGHDEQLQSNRYGISLFEMYIWSWPQGRER